MAVTGSAALSNEFKALYDADYYLAGQSRLYFDPLCNTRVQMDGKRGGTYNFPIAESLQPQTGQLDELSDVVPQQMRANEVVVTLAEYGGAVTVTEFAAATVYADVYEQAAQLNGYNMAESLDFVVRAVMGQGSRVFFPGTHVTRATLQGISTSTDRITPNFLERLSITAARTFKMPLYEDESTATVLHPYVFYDLLQVTGIRDMAIRLTPEVLFNGELAYWGGIRIIVGANQKVFWGAGAAATSSLQTTLASPANVGDTTIYVASVTNAAAGQIMTIQDAAETGNTWSDTNEGFYVTTVGTAGASGTGTGLQGYAIDPGPGDGGGLRYAHATGTTATNNASVFPFPVVGPNSITKVCSDFTGPYGKTLVTGPFDTLGRFLNFGWYGLIGYGRTRSQWIFRGEVGTSLA